MWLVSVPCASFVSLRIKWVKGDGTGDGGEAITDEHDRDVGHCRW